MKKLFIALVLIAIPCLATAQKKELSQARTHIKNGKYSDADKLLSPLMKDEANRHNKRLVQALYETVHGLYEQGNEKLYLKQQYDTAAFFSNVKRMVTVAESLDSLAPEKRKSLSEQQNGYRSNLFNGGVYFVRKGKWQEAFDYMETYMDCARQPLFKEYRYDSIDKRMPEAAYWATYAGYKMQNPVLTLRYHQEALRVESKAQFTLQFVAEARKWLNDDELYIAALKEGFSRYPEFHYFFPRLFDIYTSQGRYEEALAVADSALEVNDSSELYLFAKSTTLLRLQRYGECIACSDRLIMLNDSLPEPYFNAGTAWLEMAEHFNARTEAEQKKNAYQKARPYMERYREMMLDEKEKWGPALYRIYLNLNMGRQFDEIDRLMR